MKLVIAPPRIAALLLCAPLAALAAPPFAFSSYPLFLAPAIRPNVMVILDNSESMDATMSGKVISGNDPNTRGNIARGILRGLLTSYRDSFNFGITSFRTSSVTLYNTHAYYLGNATTMVYTNDCVAGVSASNAGRRCIANPQPGNGFGFITYDRSGDDADINDVLYSGAADNQLYGIGTSGTSYNVYASHDNSAELGGRRTSRGGFSGTWNFTPTDAGFLPTVAQTPRQLWIKRGWGYGDNITGAGNYQRGRPAPIPAAHFCDDDDAARQRDERRHRRDQEQRLLHADRRHPEHGQGLLPRRHDRPRSRRPASATSSCSRPTAIRPAADQRQPIQPVGVA